MHPGGLAKVRLIAAITPKRGVMRHLEDDSAKEFRNAPPHRERLCVLVHASSIYRKSN